MIPAISRVRRQFDFLSFALLLDVPAPHGERLRRALRAIEAEAVAAMREVEVPNILGTDVTCETVSE